MNKPGSQRNNTLDIASQNALPLPQADIGNTAGTAQSDVAAHARKPAKPLHNGQDDQQATVHGSDAIDTGHVDALLDTSVTGVAASEPLLYAEAGTETHTDAAAGILPHTDAAAEATAAASPPAAATGLSAGTWAAIGGGALLLAAAGGGGGGGGGGSSSSSSSNSGGSSNTTPPVAPTLALATDSGSSNTDHITNVATINVSGLESGATWQYQVDGGTWQTGTGSSFTASTGTHTYIVHQTDTAGNISTASSSLTVDLDTTATTPTLALATDSGSSNTDHITNVGTVTVSGLESGATWQYQVDGGTWQTGTGSSFTASTGTHTYIVHQTDTAGNISTASSSLSVTLDTTAPSAPTIATVATDDIINASEQTSAITGTSEANAAIALTLGTGNTHNVSADASGNWTYTLTAGDITALGQGADTISATATDAAGNTSTAATHNITVDTVAPTASVVAATITNTGNASVQSTETGTAYLVNDSVTVTDVASITAAVDADWNQVTITTADTDTSLAATGLAAGTYHVYTVDAAGNLSAESTNAVTISSGGVVFAESFGDNVGVLQTIPNVYSDNNNTSANYYHSGATTDDTTPTFAGTAQASSTITFYDGDTSGTVIGTTTTDSSGNWTFTPSTALSDGSHTITADNGLGSATFDVTIQDAQSQLSSGSHTMSTYIDAVTGTDIVSSTEHAAGFTITMHGVATGATFYLDNDRTNGVNEMGTQLTNTTPGVSIAQNGSDVTITFGAGSTALVDGNVHQIYVDNNHDGVMDAGDASRLFLVANGTASATDHTNYSVQDAVTKDVFVYYYGDPDGNGIGLWTRQDNGDTASSVSINTANRDPAAAAMQDNLGGPDWDYYNSGAGITNDVAQQATPQNTALGMVTNISVPTGGWEFHIAGGTTANPYATDSSYADSVADAGDHTKWNSNTSQVASLEQVLALYAANIQDNGTGSTITPMGQFKSGMYGNTNASLSIPDWTATNLLTSDPSPTGHVHVNFATGWIVDDDNWAGYKPAVLLAG